MILENICIGKRNGIAKLYLGGSNSTINPRMVDVYNDISWSKFSGLRRRKFVECQMFTLDTILKKHKYPIGFEVLVIDVEGAEKEVLRGFSISKWQPRMAIVETHEKNEDKRLSKKAKWINAFFSKHNYRKIYSDHINSVYKR